MTASSDETGRGWLPLKYEDGPDFCTVTFATGAAFALTVHPERMKLMEAALSAAPVETWKCAARKQSLPEPALKAKLSTRTNEQDDARNLSGVSSE